MRTGAFELGFNAWPNMQFLLPTCVRACVCVCICFCVSVSVCVCVCVCRHCRSLLGLLCVVLVPESLVYLQSPL